MNVTELMLRLPNIHDTASLDALTEIAGGKATRRVAEDASAQWVWFIDAGLGLKAPPHWVLPPSCATRDEVLAELRAHQLTVLDQGWDALVESVRQSVLVYGYGKVGDGGTWVLYRVDSVLSPWNAESRIDALEELLARFNAATGDLPDITAEDILANVPPADPMPPHGSVADDVYDRAVGGMRSTTRLVRSLDPDVLTAPMPVPGAPSWVTAETPAHELLPWASAVARAAHSRMKEHDAYFSRNGSFPRGFRVEALRQVPDGDAAWAVLAGPARLTDESLAAYLFVFWPAPHPRGGMVDVFILSGETVVSSATKHDRFLNAGLCPNDLAHVIAAMHMLLLAYFGAWSAPLSYRHPSWLGVGALFARRAVTKIARRVWRTVFGRAKRAATDARHSGT